MTSCRIFHSSSVTPLPQKLGRFHTMAFVSLLTWATLLSSQLRLHKWSRFVQDFFPFCFKPPSTTSDPRADYLSHPVMSRTVAERTP